MENRAYDKQDLLAIKQYENEIGEDIIKLYEIGGPLVTRNDQNELVLNDWAKDVYTDDDIIRFSKVAKENLEYCYKVDEITSGNYEPEYKVKVCNTPEWLEKMGFNSLPVYYSSWHIYNATLPKDKHNAHQHGLDIRQVKALPYIMENKPAVLIDNPSRTDSMLAVLPMVDKDNLPIIMSIKPDAKIETLEIEEIDTNMILTMFGKNNFDNYIQKNFTKDDYIYVNDMNLHILREKTGLKIVDENLDINRGVTLKVPRCIENKMVNKEEEEIEAAEDEEFEF